MPTWAPADVWHKAMPMLPRLLSVLMLHWSAASFLLCAISVDDGRWLGEAVAEAYQPFVPAAPARTAAASLRLTHKLKPASGGDDIAIGVPPRESARWFGAPPDRSLTAAGKPPLVRTFDARAPPERVSA